MRLRVRVVTTRLRFAVLGSVLVMWDWSSVVAVVVAVARVVYGMVRARARVFVIW